MKGTSRLEFKTAGALQSRLLQDILRNTADTVELPSGTRLGSWLLQEKIGAGGSGTVFLAVRRDGEVEQRSAIKVMRKAAVSDNRFQREMEVVASLNHPYIVSLIEVGQASDDILWFAMGYVDGVPLHHYVKAHKVGWQDQIRIFDELCSAVEYAHARLIIHRDLKPANILVDAHSHPRLLDFGIAFNPAFEDVPDHRMTPGYASPEQLAGDEITTASDIYQLGLILRDILDAGATAAPGLIGRDLRAVIERATQRSPEARYRAVSDIREDLARVRSGRSLAAASGNIRSTLLHFLARNLAASILATAAIALLVSMLAYFTIRVTAERDIAVQNAQRASNVLSFLTKTLTQADPYSVPIQSTEVPHKATPLTVIEAMQRAVIALMDDQAMEPSDRTLLKATLGSIFYNLGDNDSCLSLVHGATERVVDLRPLDFPTVYLISVEAECAFSAGDMASAKKSIDLVVESNHLESDFARERLGRALLTRGLLEIRTSAAAVADQTFTEVLEFADSHGIPSLQYAALRLLTGNALTVRAANAQALAARALSAADRLAGKESLQWVEASSYAAMAAIYGKDSAAAEKVLAGAQEVMATIDERGWPEIPPSVRSEIADAWGSVYFDQSRYVECASKGREALAYVEDLDAFGGHAYNAAWNTARCEVRLEHWSEVEALARRCRELAGRHMQGNLNLQANIGRLLAYSYFRQNRLGDARTAIDESMSLLLSATQQVAQITLSVWLTDALIASAEGQLRRARFLTLIADLGMTIYPPDRIPPSLMELRGRLGSAFPARRR